MLPLSRAFENILRNWLTTVPAILVMAIVLTMFHGLLILYHRAEQNLQGLEKKFSITIYLKDEADPFEIGNLITALEERSDVKKPVVYTSKEAAWQLINKTFSLDNELLKKYKFSLPASLTITPKTIEATAMIETFLETRAKHLLQDPSGSQHKQQQTIGSMKEFLKYIKRALLNILFFFTAFFILGGTFLVTATIHLTIVSRHREIGIMKLVGASSKILMSPFVIEGILIGSGAFFIHFLTSLMLFSGIEQSSLNANALLFEFIAITGLSAGASYITTYFHLRKKVIF